MAPPAATHLALAPEPGDRALVAAPPTDAAVRARDGVVDMVLTGTVAEPRLWCERLLGCAGDARAFRALEDAVPRAGGRVDVFLFADYDGEDVLGEATAAIAALGLPFPARARLVWLRPDGVARELWAAGRAA